LLGHLATSVATGPGFYAPVIGVTGVSPFYMDRNRCFVVIAGESHTQVKARTKFRDFADDYGLLKLIAPKNEAKLVMKI
jgi:hypothetical protein|tara:strand:- start:318 stop:554 length:237 start_codon:yes stop_codon:yes gene_type:complete